MKEDKKTIRDNYTVTIRGDTTQMSRLITTMGSCNQCVFWSTDSQCDVLHGQADFDKCPLKEGPVVVRLMELPKEEPITFFACGPDVCPKGGEHEWGDEFVQMDEHSWSVVCRKCRMSRMDHDMWGE